MLESYREHFGAPTHMISFSLERVRDLRALLARCWRVGGALISSSSQVSIFAFSGALVATLDISRYTPRAPSDEGPQAGRSTWPAPSTR